MSALTGKHAAVIGIDAYTNGLTALRTATGDARAVAAALREAHGYRDPIELLDEAAAAEGILHLLEDGLPAVVEPDAALVLYFAGHGIALDGDDGPQGYLIPQDGHSGQPETWLLMDRFRRALAELPCRHLLVILDCCFAGSFRWASTRKTLLPTLEPLYDSQYARFLEGTAWQVLTSASHQEEAQDVVPGRRNTRDGEGAQEHSPFAAALLAGLAGDADSSRGRHGTDGVITATELHQYVFEEVAPAKKMRRQTPGLWPLKPDNTGEFIFLSPREEKKTLPDPPLDEANNPWLGLKTYGADDTPLFFGRDRVVEALLREVRGGRSPLIRVVGASGTGKSSVVKAGLLPLLQRPPASAGEEVEEWRVVVCERLGSLPRLQLESAVERLGTSDRRRLLVIDQFEELFTQCSDPEEEARFLEELAALLTSADRRLQVLITLRSDFEPQLVQTVLDPWIEKPLGRYPVPGFSSAELREIIAGPARVRAMYFEPPELIDRLVEEVVAMPGGVPLLSFALSEMYRRAVLRRRRSGDLDRSLNEKDYRETGGVVGSLHRRANELLQDAEANGRLATVRRVALRMVSNEGGRVARRRISEEELEYPDSAQQDRVCKVLDRLTVARFLVVDDGYREPAHDTLVQAWPQLTAWLRAAAATQPLLRAVWRAATAWKDGGRASGLLWTDDPRLPQVLKMSGELNRLEQEFVKVSGRQKRRRRRFVAGVTLTVVALLAAASLRALYQRNRARNQVLATEARGFRYDRLDLALLLSLEVQRRSNGFEARRLLFEGLESTPALLQLLHGHRDAVVAVDWAPGQRSLASAGADSTVLLWDMTAAQPDGSPLNGSTDKPWSLDWSPDGRRLAAGTDDGAVLLWDADHPRAPPRRLISPAAAVYAVSWSPDGRTLATARSDHMVQLWDLEAEPFADQTLTGPSDWLTAVAWSPDAGTVAAAGMDKTIWRWTARTGEPKGPPLRGHSEGVMSLDWSADGRTLASGSLDGTAILWDPVTGEPRGQPLDGLIGPVASVAWGDDSTTLAVASVDGRLMLWDLSRQPPRTTAFSGQSAALRSMAWSSDGSTLASGNGRAVALWKPTSGSRLGLRIDLGVTEVRCVAPSGDGAMLAAEARDPISQELTLRRWNTASGEPRGAPLEGLARRAAACAWSADGETLMTAGLDGSVRHWPASTAGVALPGRFSSLAWSHDGTRLAAASHDGFVSFWDGTTGQLLSPPQAGHDGKVWRLAWSPDNSTVAAAAGDGIQLWEAANGEDRGAPLTGHDGAVVSLAWSGDGRLASGSRDLTIRLWNAASGRQEGMPLSGHQAAVTGLAWSGDGRTLASAGADRRILLWDVNRRASFASLPDGHSDAISGLFFSHDGRSLYSVSIDGTLMRWDIDSASWRRRACRIANRNLTRDEWRLFLPDSPYRQTCPELAAERSSQRSTRRTREP